MSFYYQPGETIAAIATAPGEGGVAIIRISGKKAIDIAEIVFDGPVREFKTHTVHYGQIIDKCNKPVDDILLVPMLGKKSYAGEDTIEIHCHGGSLITKKVLEVVLNAGARQAYPGEFTFKAFINGKIDLAQSEAVQELISAKNEKAMEAAKNQLQGRLSEQISTFQKKLTDIAAIIEAWIDFPEEGLEFATTDQVLQSLETILANMQKLQKSYHNGKIIHDGISLCLIGAPNVGKSSLMNALLDKDRAIVTHIPGTTRDIIEDDFRLNGLNFRLIDTAGIRENAETIEAEGIRRSKAALKKADLILLVLDANKGIDKEDKILISNIPHKKTIAVWNKTDLPHNEAPVLNFNHIVPISAKEKIGIDELHAAIDKVIWEKGPPSKEEILITNSRHKEALDASISSTKKVIDGFKENLSPELIASDMKNCLQELSKIIGTNVGEDILSSIFSKFCVGK